MEEIRIEFPLIRQPGYLYWGDVGPDAGSDSVNRGPRAYDEVNQARKAGFYRMAVFCWR